jgi:predicted acyltransferase (DUF342 family)
MNKERIVNKTETAIIFEKKRAMRDRDFQKIFPEDFKGDIIVNGDIFLEEVNMISGNLIVTGDIKFSRHLIVNGNIICYGNIFSKNQDALDAKDIVCSKKVYVGNLKCTSIIAQEIDACNINAVDCIICAEKVDALSIHTSDFLVAKSSLTELNALNANADLIVAYVINVYGNCEAKKIIKVK